MYDGAIVQVILRNVKAPMVLVLFDGHTYILSPFPKLVLVPAVKTAFLKYFESSKSRQNLSTIMAPLVRIAIQYLLGSSHLNKPCHQDVEDKTVSPLVRSSISLSTFSWAHNRLDVFGTGPDGDVKHKWYDGYQWNPLSVEALESLGYYTTEPPAAISWGPDRTDVFVVGGGDGSLWHKYWDGSGWRPSVKGFEKLGGKLAYSYALAATTWGQNRLDIFGVGPDSDDKYALWHKYWDGSSWNPSDNKLEHLGGDFVSEPAAVSWGPNRLDVFAIDRHRNLLHRYWDGTNWVEWEVLGENFASTPTAVSWGPDRLDVFVVRAGRISNLFHKYWDGHQWSDWENLGGDFISAVSVTSWSKNRFDIVGLGPDFAYYYKYWDGYQWNPSVTDWIPKHGNFSSAPSLVSWGENRLDIFGVDADSKLGHQTWYGSGWYPSEKSWEALGGPLQSF